MFLVMKGKKWCLLRVSQKGEAAKYRWSQVSRTHWARKDEAIRALKFVQLTKKESYTKGAKVVNFMELPETAVVRPEPQRLGRVNRRPRGRRSGRRRLFGRAVSSPSWIPSATLTPLPNVSRVEPPRIDWTLLGPYDILRPSVRPVTPPEPEVIATASDWYRFDPQPLTPVVEASEGGS